MYYIGHLAGAHEGNGAHRSEVAMREKKIYVMGGEAKRSKIFLVRLTELEFLELRKRQSETAYKKISDYARALLFSKPVRIISRNRSMDDLLEELVLLRIELKAIGNNFNQAVKRMNSMSVDQISSSQVIEALMFQRTLLKKIEEIQLRIDKVSEKWW